MGMGPEESEFSVGGTVNFQWTKKIPQGYLTPEGV